MTQRNVWSLITSVVLVACWARPSAAQYAGTTPGAQRPAMSAEALPSAVSGEIARFVARSGRDVSSVRPPLPMAFPRPAPPRPATAPPRPVQDPASGIRNTAPARRSPLAERVTLGPAPFDPTDRRFPINLATALRLADARPLIVAAAQARVWIAEGELTRAKVLWVPDLWIGADYYRHDGGGPDFNKGILTAPSLNFFYGGAGLDLFIGTTDAIFDPVIARQVVTARHWDIQMAKNDALLQTADAYFRVHQHRGTYAGTLYTVTRGRDLIDKIAHLSPDLVPAYEVDRARNMVADLEQLSVLARQQWRVESARLTRILRLDPRAVVEPLEHDHVQITLIDPARELDDLMAIALTNRPEISSCAALVASADAAVRREKARPFIPSILLDGFNPPSGMLYNGGIMGLGPNSSLNQWRGRDDVTIQVIWQLQNFGFGNLGRIKQHRGEQSNAIVALRNAQDSVAEEVNAAHARVQSAAARVMQAERSLRTGIITLNGAVEGLGQTSRFGDVLNLISRPQEAVYALSLLQKAFDEYFRTVADYNCAQFDLFHALGYPAREIAQFRSPGQVVPVDTARPPYLPRVGSGPPPASR